MNPRFSRPVASVFEALFGPVLRARLRARIFVPERQPVADVPVLFVSNHVSWWDGFLLRALQRRIRPDAPLFTVMLERELRPRPWFRLLGCVGLDPSNRDSWKRAREAITAAASRDPTACIAFFPQGRIRTAQARPLGFRPGVAKLAAALAPVQVVPVALRIEPLNTFRPNAFVVAGEPLHFAPSAPVDPAALEARAGILLDRLAARLDELGEDAARPFALRAGGPSA